MTATDEPTATSGHFWLPDDPNNRVPGTLTLNPAEGVDLSLIGALGREPGGLFGADKDMPRILGEADGKYLTLVDAFQRNYRATGLSGTPTQNVHATYAFIGARFDPPEEIAFSKMYFGLEDLTTWVGRSGIQETPRYGSNGIEQRAATGTRLPDEAISLDGYTLKMWHQVHWQPTKFRAGVLSERHRFAVLPDELTGWRNLMRIAGDLGDMLSLAFDYPAAFDGICFEVPEGPGRQIDMHAQWQTQLGTRAEPPSRLTFSFDDLGGMEGMRRWLGAASLHRRAISRITATRRRGSMFLEDRLMNCAAAAEGLHRKHVTTERRTFAVRLAELIELAGDEFKSALPGHPAWIRAVVKERNEHAHHFDQRVEGEDPWLMHLGTSTYWLALMCLLRIADAPKAVESVASCDQFIWDMSQMRTLLSK